MRALVVDENGVLSVKEFPKPVCEKNKAIVKMLSCGVCNGTDMKLIHRAFKNFDTYPAILGHEGVGEVVEIGENVKNLKIGDHVLLPFLENEIDGHYPAWGAYSEYAVVGDEQALTQEGQGLGTEGYAECYSAQTVLDKEIDPVDASMIITFREVLSAIKRFGFQENKAIAIFGAGPVGLCFTRFCKLLGLKTIITMDVVDSKVEEAKNMGADYAFNSMNVEVEQEIRKICPGGVDYVVDAVGINQLINQAMGLIKDHGKICCYGISPKLSMELDWSKAPYNWSLDFVQWPSKVEEAEAHAQIVSWIQLGVLDPKDFISDVIAFDNIIDAFKMIEEKKAKKKIVIKF